MILSTLFIYMPINLELLDEKNESLNISYVNGQKKLISLINFTNKENETKMEFTPEGKSHFGYMFDQIKNTENIDTKEFFKILISLDINKNFTSKYSESKMMDFNTFSYILKQASKKEEIAYLADNTYEENLDKFSYGIKLNPLNVFILKDDKRDLHSKLDKVFDEKTTSIDAVIIQDASNLGKKVNIKAFSDESEIEYMKVNKTIMKTLEDSRVSVPKIQLEKTNDRFYWIEEKCGSPTFNYMKGFVGKDYLEAPNNISIGKYFEKLTGKPLKTECLGYLYAAATIIYEHSKKGNESPSTAFSKINNIVSNKDILEKVSGNKTIQELYKMIAFNIQLGNENMNANSISLQISTETNKPKLGYFSNIEPTSLNHVDGMSLFKGKILSNMDSNMLFGTQFSVLSKVNGFKKAWNDASVLISNLKENIQQSPDINLAKKEEMKAYFETPLDHSIIQDHLSTSSYAKKRTRAYKLS